VPALTDQITGYVDGQNSSVVTGAATITTTATSASTVAGGPYTITIAVGSLSAPNYTFTTFNNGSLSVTPAPLTVTANNTSMVYGATVPALTDLITGFVNGQNSSVVTGSVTITTTATPTSTVAGSPYPITIATESLSASNYTFTSFNNSSLSVTPAPLTITANDAAMVYGATVRAFTDQITGFLNGQNGGVVTGAATITTTATSASNVAGGPYAIMITAGTLSAPNYSFTNLVNALLTVTPAPLTVTANNTSMVYGAAVPAFTDQITGFLNGQNRSVVDGAATITTTATSASTVAGGPYTITIVVGSLSAPNYTFTTFNNGSLSVTPAPLTVTANNASMVYGAAVPALTDQITGFVNGQNSSVVTGSVTITTTATPTSTVAGSPYPITIAAGTLSAPNYRFTNLVNGFLTVNAYAFSYTIGNDSQTYGNPAYLAEGPGSTIATGVNGENLVIAYSSTGDTATAHVNTYSITGALADGTGLTSDYAVTLTPGTLTVTPAPLTVTAESAAKDYGAALPALSDQITGFVNGDTTGVVSGAASLTTTATASSAAGVYSIHAAPGTLSAADYAFPAAGFFGSSLTVTPAPLTITAVSQTIKPGQAIPTLAATISGFVNGDTAASLATPPTFSTPATSASPAGTYPIVVTGASSPNYAIRFVNGTLTVTVTTAPATVEAVSIQKVKKGKHRTSQVIVLQFSEALNSADAQMINSYNLVTVPIKKKQHSKSVAIALASYNASRYTVTLTTRKKLVLNPPLKLTIIAVALLDAFNRPLDGNDSGLPGANYVATISKGHVTVDS